MAAKIEKPERKNQDLPSHNPFQALAHDSSKYKPKILNSKVDLVQDKGHQDSRKSNNSKVTKDENNKVVKAQNTGPQDSNKVTVHVNNAYDQEVGHTTKEGPGQQKRSRNINPSTSNNVGPKSKYSKFINGFRSGSFALGKLTEEEETQEEVAQDKMKACTQSWREVQKNKKTLGNPTGEENKHEGQSNQVKVANFHGIFGSQPLDLPVLMRQPRRS